MVIPWGSPTTVVSGRPAELLLSETGEVLEIRRPERFEDYVATVRFEPQPVRSPCERRRSRRLPERVHERDQPWSGSRRRHRQPGDRRLGVRPEDWRWEMPTGARQLEGTELVIAYRQERTRAFDVRKPPRGAVIGMSVYLGQSTPMRASPAFALRETTTP